MVDRIYEAKISSRNASKLYLSPVGLFALDIDIRNTEPDMMGRREFPPK